VPGCCNLKFKLTTFEIGVIPAIAKLALSGFSQFPYQSHEAEGVVIVMPTRDYGLESLSDGISRMPRKLTTRERLADHVFFYLQITSRFVFVIGGIGGYELNGPLGSIVAITCGWLVGIWMRRSLGIRGPDPFHGYFRRIRERAEGSSRGLLELVIEFLRGGGFTVSKCREITAAYDHAMGEAQAARLPDQRQAILLRLDAEVKRISYRS
jgi:hypothetical protein